MDKYDKYEIIGRSIIQKYFQKDNIRFSKKKSSKWDFYLLDHKILGEIKYRLHEYGTYSSSVIEKKKFDFLKQHPRSIYTSIYYDRIIIQPLINQREYITGSTFMNETLGEPKQHKSTILIPFDYQYDRTIYIHKDCEFYREGLTDEDLNFILTKSTNE